MRLATTISMPVVPLAVLSLATWASIARSPVPALTPLNADVVSSVESVVVREQVRAPRGGWPHHSVWRGTYVCAQGESGMTLTVDVSRSGVATARYDFGPIESNPTVPTGAFLLAGSLQPQDGGGFVGELDATKWIVHPDDYFMVALTISSDDGRRLIGKSHHETCREFEITRIE